MLVESNTFFHVHMAAKTFESDILCSRVRILAILDSDGTQKTFLKQTFCAICYVGFVEIYRV